MSRNESTALGRAFLLQVDLEDSDTDPHWIDLSNEADTTLQRSHVTVDRRAKVHGGAPADSVVGTAWGLSSNGHFDLDGAAADKILKAMDSPGSLDWKIHVQLKGVDGPAYEGWVIVESFEIATPNAELAGYSASFVGQGHIITV